MKNLFLIFVITLFFASCENINEAKKKFTISCPDKSLQMRFYYNTDKFSIDENGCVNFIPIEDSTHTYHICNGYDIEKNN